MGHDPYSTLQMVDRSLRRVRFEPRSSLQAELLWRIRQGEPRRADRLDGISLGSLLILAALAAGILVFFLWVKLLTLTLSPG